MFGKDDSVFGKDIFRKGFDFILFFMGRVMDSFLHWRIDWGFNNSVARLTDTDDTLHNEY